MSIQVDELGIYVFLVFVLIVPVWRMFRRAGLAPAWSLLMLLPMIGIPIVVWMFAFSKWPAVHGSQGIR
jgi:hypothetical protein